jgi:chromosome segregation ATPase
MSTDRLTEILNYLSAISRDIGELRSEMRAKFTEVEAKFAEMQSNFDTIHSDIRHLSRKVDVINRDLLDLRAGQQDLEQRTDALESKQA